MRRFNLIPSEKKSRKLSKECSLADIIVEMVPYSFVVDKRIIMQQAPMAYVTGLRYGLSLFGNF